jgi:endonuclease/exonuclease/phosphatase family metal-dependent hydrolase
MRFATWNMSHAVKKDPDCRSAAWKHLCSLGVDVAMVQEAGLPVLDVAGQVLEQPDPREPRKGDWVTAVVSYGPPLNGLTKVRAKGREFRIPDAARAGTVALAEVDAFGGVLAVSLYGRLRYAAQSVLRAASDLLPLFDTALGKRVIVAGDLNMHTAARDKTERAQTEQILGLLESLGLQDLLRVARDGKFLIQRAPPCPCKYKKPCSHVRTHRHPHHRADAIGSVDYMYATAELADRLQSLLVLNGDNDPAWEHSDHAPMIAEFRV